MSSASSPPDTQSTDTAERRVHTGVMSPSSLGSLRPHNGKVQPRKRWDSVPMYQAWEQAQPRGRRQSHQGSDSGIGMGPRNVPNVEKPAPLADLAVPAALAALLVLLRRDGVVGVPWLPLVPACHTHNRHRRVKWAVSRRGSWTSSIHIQHTRLGRGTGTYLEILSVYSA